MLLRDWIPTQRWYGDKSRAIDELGIDLIAHVDASGRNISLFDVSVRFDDRMMSRYFVPIEVRESAVVDGMAIGEFVAWFSAGFAESRQLDLSIPGHIMRWSSSGDTEWTREAGQLLQGEQSNSSLLFGDLAVVKVFRRLQPGLNPDSEIVSFLTTQGTFKQVPRFLGAVTIERPGADPIELAAAQNFVANEGDCWRWLPPALADQTEDIDRLVGDIWRLGQRTGELHAALAGGSGDGFAPESVDMEEAGEIRVRLESEVQRTIPMLMRAEVVDSSEAKTIEQELLGRLVRTEELVGTLRTRVHGDYHLGQVLRTGDDFVIIDFEGEPSRSLIERREMHSPLKDVAGMLRSIDYAVATAKREAGADRRLQLDQWKVRANQAFLDGYRDGAASAPDGMLPADNNQFLHALDVYMIEKALYEVRYEFDNRPDWIEIPFGALRDIARAD